MADTRETPGYGQEIEYGEIVNGDVINFDSIYVTVQYTDSHGIYDVFGNHYPMADLPRDIYFIRSIFE